MANLSINQTTKRNIYRDFQDGKSPDAIARIYGIPGDSVAEALEASVAQYAIDVSRETVEGQFASYARNILRTMQKLWHISEESAEEGAYAASVSALNNYNKMYEKMIDRMNEFGLINKVSTTELKAEFGVESLSEMSTDDFYDMFAGLGYKLKRFEDAPDFVNTDFGEVHTETFDPEIDKPKVEFVDPEKSPETGSSKVSARITFTSKGKK